MAPVTQNPQHTPQQTDVERAEKRADWLIAMLQGTMGLEGQGLSQPSLVRLREVAKKLILET